MGLKDLKAALNDINKADAVNMFLLFIQLQGFTS